MRKQYPSQETVRRLLDYDKETGIFTWKERPLSDFKDDMNPSMSHITWNSQYKDAIAGSTTGSYVRIQIGKTPFAAHKLAWIHTYGDEYQGDLDHKNRDKRDNRIDNLRPATISQNVINSGLYKTNTSGIKGVMRGKKDGLWKAGIMVRGKPINLGSYHSLAGAAKARYEAELKYGFIEYDPQSTAYKYLQEA